MTKSEICRSMIYVGIGGVTVTCFLFLLVGEVHWISWVWGGICLFMLLIGIVWSLRERM